jgi:hypothetical protein
MVFKALRPKGGCMKEREKAKREITRREFLQYTAAAGAATAFPWTFFGCSGNSGSGGESGMELRTYYFDLSHTDSRRQFELVSGAKVIPLKPLTKEGIAKARADNPLLRFVEDRHITHVIENVEFPSDAVGLCWVLGYLPEESGGEWSLPLMFYHIPIGSLLWAYKSSSSRYKWELYGADPEAVDVFRDDPSVAVLPDSYKDWL